MSERLNKKHFVSPAFPEAGPSREIPSSASTFSGNWAELTVLHIMRMPLVEHLGILPTPSPDTGKYYYIHISPGNWGFKLRVPDRLLCAEPQNLLWTQTLPGGGKFELNPFQPYRSNGPVSRSGLEQGERSETLRVTLECRQIHALGSDSLSAFYTLLD